MHSTSKTRRLIEWRALAVEVLSIIIGVLIALAMDEWNENRQNNNKAEQALINIRLELASNLKILNTLHEPNAFAYEILQAGDDAMSDSLTILPGLQLQETAWTTLINTGVSAYIAYENLYEIAELYTMIQIYKEVGNRFIDYFSDAHSLNAAMGREISDDEIIKSNLPVLGMMVSIEGQLVEHIQTYLEPVRKQS